MKKFLPSKNFYPKKEKFKNQNSKFKKINIPI